MTLVGQVEDYCIGPYPKEGEGDVENNGLDSW